MFRLDILLPLLLILGMALLGLFLLWELFLFPDQGCDWKGVWKRLKYTLLMAMIGCSLGLSACSTQPVLVKTPIVPPAAAMKRATPLPPLTSASSSRPTSTP